MNHREGERRSREPRGVSAPKAGLIYCVLKGNIVDAKPFSQNPRDRPHLHLLLQNGDGSFDVAVNVASSDPHVEDVRVLYAIKDGAGLPNLAAIAAFEGTLIDPDSDDGDDLRLDYVAQRIVSRSDMQLLPLFDSESGTLQDDPISTLVDQALADPAAVVYAFGHQYTDNQPVNAAFQFSPDAGVHNIHMNQGNARGSYDDENGRFNDGALLVHFGNPDRWVLAAIAFQTQSWDNDDRGVPLTGSPPYGAEAG